MGVPFPQSDLPSNVRGGSNVWDTDASVVISDDYFPSSVQSGTTLKRWTGSAWVSKPLKRWNGTTWVPVVLKRWNGASWVAV